MQDRPSAAELILSVKEHLEREVMPALQNPKLRYQTLVAAHVLSVVEREVVCGEGLLREELTSLLALKGAGPPGTTPTSTSREVADEVLERTRALCVAIRSGDVGDPSSVRAHVRRVALAKLSIANPGYTSLHAAREAEPPPPPRDGRRY